MAFDKTQHQSTDELRKARELSLEPTRPPAQVPGYKLQKFLGSGAYGEVWSANDLKTGRKVAIKFYTRRTSADVQLLAREVEKLVVLAADRYVVQLFDVGWDANPPYYVMDFIEHGSLEDRLNSGNGIPTSEALELFREVATGMMHLHGKGVLHCDLKPGNVLLDQDGKPRVADFGQSRLSTEQASALGTLFYMAPEQADLHAVPDARWDVYGLGALLFSMLTGKPPYYSSQLANRIEATDDISNRLTVYRKSLQSAPKPTEHRAVAGVDRSMADIIDRCIIADPKKRFSNIQSLLLALRQRELAKARRPLMVLGLLGPLLLISVMSLFGWSAFRQSVDKTQLEVTNKSVESNTFAAQLAASSAAEQIDKYFRAVGQLSRDPGFIEVYEKVVTDPVLLAQRIAISDPSNNAKGITAAGVDIGTIRQAFRNHPLRLKLQPFLEQRLSDESGDFPIAASWFVSDRFGNQIASAFRRENKTLGNNYAYRTYFTGLDKDLNSGGEDEESPKEGGPDNVADDLDKRQIIEQPHLSAVFISEQSNTWKVAFSAPIIRDDKVDGIVAVTVDLGNLIDFENLKDHYAMLVDTRRGDNRGRILEHPLFQQVLIESGRIPDELAQCSVDLDVLQTSKRLVDPVGSTKIGQAAGYNHESIVAMAPVTKEENLATNNSNTGNSKQIGTSNDAIDDETSNRFLRSDTGLVVLALENYESILKPAKDLSEQLGNLAKLAAVFLMIVTVGMWFFVNRMLQESRQRLERSFSPTSDSGSLETKETVAASQKTPVLPGDTECDE